VHEWFRRFCELHEGGAVEAGERRRGKGGKRARGEGGAGGGGASDEKAEKTRGEAEAGTGTGAKGTFGLEKNRLWELQARFTRAVAELEFLGVARPVKRRKVEYMQRTAFPLDQLLEAR
jgi:origin recognition complex subunit 3